MFNKIAKFFKSLAQRVKRTFSNIGRKIKTLAKNVVTALANKPALAFVVSAVVTAAATAVAIKVGELKLIKSVIASGVMFISGLTCLAWRNLKAKNDREDIRAYCDSLIAQEEQNAEA